MNRECRYAQEAIWDSARTGSRFSNEIQTHIAECDSCTQAQKEAAILADALAKAVCVPGAPDCRSAVMARISNATLIYRRAWVYACAVAVIAVGLGVLVLSPKPSQRAPMVVNNIKTPAKPHLTPIIRHEVKKGVVAVRTATTRTETPTIHKQAAPVKHIHAHKQVAPQPVRQSSPMYAQKPETHVEPEQPEPPVNDIGRPIAIAVVTWPDPNNQTPNEYSYSYSEKDPETGIVTNCSVVRSGDSYVKVMEVKPANDQSPKKRSMNHETNPNA